MKRLQNYLNQTMVIREIEIIEAIKKKKEEKQKCDAILDYIEHFKKDGYVYIINENFEVSKLFINRTCSEWKINNNSKIFLNSKEFKSTWTIRHPEVRRKNN